MVRSYGYRITVNYREACRVYGCKDILFDHDGPIRGDGVVTRKTTRAVGLTALGLQHCLYLGNIFALRDCGNARACVEMQWLMRRRRNRMTW